MTHSYLSPLLSPLLNTREHELPLSANSFKWIIIIDTKQRKAVLTSSQVLVQELEEELEGFILMTSGR